MSEEQQEGLRRLGAQVLRQFLWEVEVEFERGNAVDWDQIFERWSDRINPAGVPSEVLSTVQDRLRDATLAMAVGARRGARLSLDSAKRIVDSTEVWTHHIQTRLSLIQEEITYVIHTLVGSSFATSVSRDRLSFLISTLSGNEIKIRHSLSAAVSAIDAHNLEAARHNLMQADRTVLRLLRQSLDPRYRGRGGDSLLVIADLNAVPAEVVADFMAALDEVHRASGGGGLIVRTSHTGSDVAAGVTA